MAKKTQHHEVKYEDLQEWLTENEMVFASSTRERKRLAFSLNGILKVTVAGNVVWQGTNPFVAVEAYNSITDRYKDDTLKNFKL